MVDLTYTRLSPLVRLAVVVVAEEAELGGTLLAVVGFSEGHSETDVAVHAVESGVLGG